jgi:cytidyltransferase-like protein
MKKAMIVGGSNGLGYALVRELLSRNNYKIIILDRVAPPSDDPRIEYNFIDLSLNELNVLDKYEDIDILIITAGIGRIAPFDTFSDIEIEKNFRINVISVIKIINYFYPRIKSKEDNFYCAVVSSISGIISSPLFSLYAATKSALFRFIESINIELEKEGAVNRILNICPGVLKGTSFYGDKSNFQSLHDLSSRILNNIEMKKVLFIPDFEETYQEVINRYVQDPHKFGLESYDYKMAGNRINQKSSVLIGYLSGTFDLFHIGHLNLLRRAKSYCDYLIVGVHKDASHKNKVTFIPFEERCEIVGNIKYVNKVIESKPEDIDVHKEIPYNFLFVGSDYKGTARFKKYEEYFKDKNVKIIYFPYTQETNSTKLRAVLEVNQHISPF